MRVNNLYNTGTLTNGKENDMTNQEIIEEIVANMLKMTEWQATNWLDEMRSDCYGDKAQSALISKIWNEYKRVA